MYINQKRKIWHLIVLASLMAEICMERDPELPEQWHLKWVSKSVCVCVCNQTAKS